MRFAEGLLDHERSVMCIVSVLLTDMIRTMLLEERVYGMSELLTLR